MKIIKNTDNKYAISKHGVVWRIKGGLNFKREKPPHRLTPVDNGNGYLYVRLNNKNYYIHRLVAEYFIYNPNNLTYVGHKDHNKKHNDFTNLYWTTASENTKHGCLDGKINYKGRINNSMNYNSDELITKIYIEYYTTKIKLQSLSKKYNISRTTISSWLHKRSKKELTDKIDKYLY